MSIKIQLLPKQNEDMKRLTCKKNYSLIFVIHINDLANVAIEQLEQKALSVQIRLQLNRTTINFTGKIKTSTRRSRPF